MKLNPLSHLAAITLTPLAALFLSVAALFGADSPPRELTVFKGGASRVEVADGVNRVFIANDRVIDAKPEKDGLSVLVSGLAEGTSELRIVKVQGGELILRVVVQADLQETVRLIQTLLLDVEGVDVTPANGKILIKGTILTVADDQKVRKVVEAYAGSVINVTKLDQSRIYGYLEQEIQKDLVEAGLDTVKARIVRDQVRLTGVVINQEEADRAMKIAQLRLPNPVNMTRIEDAMIETDIEFIQVNTDRGTTYGQNVMKTLGSIAEGSFSGGNRGKPGLTFGVSASASARVNWLIGSGSASNLLRTHLSTKNGEEGRFQSGGQDNIAVSGTTGGDLKTVDYGIIVRVKPLLRSRDYVENQVSVEVSVPIQKTREGLVLDKFNSTGTVVCKKGESVILSGLLQSLSGRTTQRTPLLGYVPVLDLFFSEKEKRRGSKELVVVLTPRPSLPTAAPAEPFSAQGQRLQQAAQATP